MIHPPNMERAWPRRLVDQIVDLFYPPLCAVCEERLSHGDEQICPGCLDGFSLIGKSHEAFSVTGEIYLRKAWAIFDFDDALQSLIHQLKYARRRKPILKLLNFYCDEIKSLIAQESYDFVIPIPLHPAKLRERGYNQVSDMANWVGREMGLAIGENLVSRRRYTSTQTKLSAVEREKNMLDAFQVSMPEGMEMKNILLVDDVLTTGATANALATVLVQAGVNQVDLLTLSTPQLTTA